MGLAEYAAYKEKAQSWAFSPTINRFTLEDLAEGLAMPDNPTVVILANYLINAIEMLAECYKLTGAHPENDPNWKLAEMATYTVFGKIDDDADTIRNLELEIDEMNTMLVEKNAQIKAMKIEFNRKLGAINAIAQHITR